MTQYITYDNGSFILLSIIILNTILNTPPVKEILLFLVREVEVIQYLNCCKTVWVQSGGMQIPGCHSLRIRLQQRMLRPRGCASTAQAHICRTRGAAEGDGEKWPWII